MAGTTGVSGTGNNRTTETDDVVTIVLDRRSAENLYYSLALSLGGVGRSVDRTLFDAKKGKPRGKGKGKVPKGYSQQPPKGW
jgi:hypothetical protein